MNTMRSLRALALASTCLLPLAAAAQSSDNFDVEEKPAAAQEAAPTHPGIALLPLPALEQLPANFRNEVIIGGGWQSNVAPHFGRFTGLTDQGGFGIGGFTMSGGGAWDSNDPFYYQLQGTDLGIDGRNVGVKVGKQGTWGLNFGYDSIPDDYSKTFQSVWGTGGGLVNGVAPGSISNVTKQLTGKLSIYDVYMRRDILTGGGKYQVGDWTVAAQIRHEHKEGIKENSLAIMGAPAPIANNGNITTSALGYFPEPVNYDTDRYDLTAQLAMPKLQVLVGYTYNQFTDQSLSWNGVNPFRFASGAGVTGSSGTAASGSALVSSRYALPPSNSAHQFKLQLGYNVTPTTRVNANVQYGLMFQNSDYAAGTGNANLATLAPPRSSFNGAIQTFHGNAALTARPLPKADVRLSYTIDSRDNISPRDQYKQYYQDAYAASPNGAYNIPLSYQHQTAEIEAGYRILPETKITVGYAYDATHRTYSSTNNVNQNTFNVKLRSKLWGDNYGSLGYTHEERRASNYQVNAAWNALKLNESEFYGFVNYYEASRRRDEVKAMLDFAPLPNLTASLIGRADYDFYPNSALGLKSNNNFNIGPDINFRFSNSLSAHAYYNYQLIFFNQNSALKNATCNGNGTTLTTGPAPCLNNGVWNGRNTDSTHTAGLGLDWQAIPEKLKISGDYTFSYGRNSYSIMDGGIYSFTPAGTAALQVAPIPDVVSTLNSLSLRAEYTFTPSMALWVGYTFERFNYKDYGTQVAATQFSNAIFSGDANPSYSVHLIMAALRVRW